MIRLHVLLSESCLSSSKQEEGRRIGKAALGLMLTALAMNVLCTSSSISVQAQGTIYIRPDGAVDPPTASIQRIGDTYIFTSDIHLPIIVERDDIVVDGAGHKLEGTAGFGSRGIELIERRNITIKNMEIGAFFDGILLLRCSDSSIVGIKIVDIAFGLTLMEPSSSNNSIINNTFINSGMEVSQSYGNRVENNTVNGKPLVYLEGVSNRKVSSAGQVILVNCTNITVENQDLSNTQVGLQLLGTDNSIITGNRMANDVDGIELTFSSNNTISRNNITKMYWYGIQTSYASNNNIVGNRISDNRYGINLGYSSNNSLSGNLLSGNTWNFFVEGWALEHFIQLIDVSNLVNGKPIYYLVAQNDLVINRGSHPEVGFLALVECTNATVEGLTLTGNCEGIIMAYSNNSRIRGNNITSNWKGICLYGSLNNTIVENNITDSDVGIYLEVLEGLFVAEGFARSSGNCIMGNTIRNNEWGVDIGNGDNNTVTGNSFANNEIGIFLQVGTLNNIFRNNITNNQIGLSISYSQCSVFENNITSNIKGIELESSGSVDIIANNIVNNGHGVWLTYASNNNIHSNKITGNNISINGGSSSHNNICGNNITAKYYGIWLGRSSSNHIVGNNISASACGIALDNSTDNVVYHNNFFDNAQQVDSYVSTSVWDDGYPSGGNYWSDCAGVDKFGGLNQNESGSDGVGDTPYDVDMNNRDRYPLMRPYYWTPPDIAVANVTTSKTIVGQGLGLRINVSIKNLGQRTENFNITVYATGPYTKIVQTQWITLQSLDDTTLSSKWNTTFIFVYPDNTTAMFLCGLGNYSIWACASGALGETDTTDNMFIDGLITITIPGDINADSEVNIVDISLAAVAYQSYPSHGKWNPNADIDENYIINIVDIAAIAKEYGKTV